MAKFQMEIPDDLIKEFQRLNKGTDAMLGELTRAGAEAVAINVRENAPQKIKPYVKTSVTYKTPTDGGINTKVYISGYIPFSNPNRKYFSRKGGNGSVYSTDKGVPADFLAKVYEYGRSNAPFPKHQFWRRSWKTRIVELAMEKKARQMFKEDIPFEIIDAQNPFV
jgi:hypothetical protein